jgi:hypothetical protein
LARAKKVVSVHRRKRTRSKKVASIVRSRSFLQKSPDSQLEREEEPTFGVVILVLNVDILLLRLFVRVLEPVVLHVRI